MKMKLYINSRQLKGTTNVNIQLSTFKMLSVNIPIEVDIPASAFFPDYDNYRNQSNHVYINGNGIAKNEMGKIIGKLYWKEGWKLKLKTNE